MRTWARHSTRRPRPRRGASHSFCQHVRVCARRDFSSSPAVPLMSWLLRMASLAVTTFGAARRPRNCTESRSRVLAARRACCDRTRRHRPETCFTHSCTRRTCVRRRLPPPAAPWSSLHHTLFARPLRRRNARAPCGGCSPPTVYRQKRCALGCSLGAPVTDLRATRGPVSIYGYGMHSGKLFGERHLLVAGLMATAVTCLRH